jgi:hypothetical protein
MDQKVLSEFTGAVMRLRPILNRLVFFGIETCRGQFDSAERVRSSELPLRKLHALTTGPLQRLSPELTTLGFSRTGRQGGREVWNLGDGVTVELESSADDYGADAEGGILEYATLLTRTISLESGDAARVSALPAQLALLWRAHRQSGLEFSASPWAEDLIELVVRRAGIYADAAALPPELRAVVARSAAEFASSETALWTIERALPDARSASGCAGVALARFRQLASLAA